MDERYIAAVDLGSYKIALTVAKVEGENVQVIYYDETPSDGIRYSSVFNPQKVLVPLSASIKKAESELGIKILQAVVGLPRYEVKQESAEGEIPRSDPSSSITREEIENLKNMALDNYPLEDSSKEIIYGAVAQSFSTDDYFQSVEDDVEGMVSETLKGNFKVFVGNRKSVNNIDKVFNDAGVAIARKYFVPDALAKIVLTNEEMDNGVALIDFGGGVTSVSVYRNGILRHYSAIPFGGNSITGDIKLEGGFSMSLAESIKLAYGACMPEKLASMSEKIIRVCYKDSGAEKQLPVKYLSEIITCRLEEIVQAILYEIQESGFADELRSGVVITGGGADMVNIGNFVKEISGYNVRVGYPRHKYSASGCPGVGETSSAGVIGMLMAAKNDKHLNCLEEPPKGPAVEDEVPVEDIEEDNNKESVFDKDAWEVQAPAKTKPARTPKSPRSFGTWKKINKLMTSLYEGMEDE